MSKFNFYDIPAGKYFLLQFCLFLFGGFSVLIMLRQVASSVECVMSYGQDAVVSEVDDTGEVYYYLDGTDKTFQLQARTNLDNPSNIYRVEYIPHGIGTQDVAIGTKIKMQDRGGQRAVDFVLTGSEKVGYWSSVNPPTTWMASIYHIITDRKLKYICMPGRGDAGMSLNLW
jgi:hypothetical protein